MPQILHMDTPKPAFALDAGVLQFPSQILNIGVSTSALFDTREDDAYFQAEGELAYMRRMRERADRPFEAGPILPFVRKMLSLNTPDFMCVNLTILSRNNPQVAARVHCSLYEHGLVMKDLSFRFGTGEAYMRGRPISPDLLRCFGVDLFLTPHRQDVENALRNGIAAGQTFHSTLSKVPSFSSPNVLMAYDFDRVLALRKGWPQDKFKGDGEAYFRQYGLFPYSRWEAKRGKYPAFPAAFADLYMKTAWLRQKLVEQDAPRKLELAIVTASSSNALQRVQTTMDYWGGPLAEPDYLLSTGNTSKANHLACLQADVHFDDSEKHIEGALNTTAAVLVPQLPPLPKRRSAKPASDGPERRN